MAIILYVTYGAVQFGTYYELKKLYGGYVRCARIVLALFSASTSYSLAAAHTLTVWAGSRPTGH